jgi:hypothetical protein
MYRFLTILAALSLLGCGDGARDHRDTRGTDGDTLRMVVAWEVAPGLHAAADSLGDVSGVAVDPDGNVYVTDFLAARVWVFGAEGELRRALGRKGQGPGEFEAPTGPAIGPDGRLYVRDVYRVSIFGLDPASGLRTRFESTFDGPVYADWTSRRTTRFDGGGALFYPGTRWRDGGSALPFVVRYTPEGVLTDTIFAPDQAAIPRLTAFVRTGPGGGRMIPGLSHVPFAARPVWDVTPDGTMITGDGASYELVEMDDQGQVITRFTRAVAPDRIPQQERADSIAALRSRLESVPVPLDQVEGMPPEVRELAVPSEYPLYMAVYVGVTGNVWVRRWPVGGEDVTIFDVFARGGDYQRTVVLPRAIRVEPTPYLSPASIVGVASHPLTDESIVIWFSRPWPEGEREASRALP